MTSRPRSVGIARTVFVALCLVLIAGTLINLVIFFSYGDAERYQVTVEGGAISVERGRLPGWPIQLRDGFQCWCGITFVPLPKFARFGTMHVAVVPYWPLTMAVTLWLAVCWSRTRSRRLPGHCTSCGYDLTGNHSGVCPECGADARPAEEAIP